MTALTRRSILALAAAVAVASGFSAPCLLPVEEAHASPPRAPAGPPLTGADGTGVDVGLAGAGIGAFAGATPSQESSASAPPSGGDVLTENGLSSPLCDENVQLAGAMESNCRTSGFVAAREPTGDYAFDVNIDTGLGNLSNSASAILLDFAEQGWMALVAITHALIVMFEWCYSLRLLGGAVTSQIAAALHSARLTITEPWMAFALALAAVLAIYRGIVRRRVAETAAQALVMLAMMAGGLWVMADPAGTVGALQRWADEGAAGMLAVASGADRQHPQSTLATSMSGLFAAVITGPWCYMEFGNVGWCEDPSRLDPRLRRAAVSIAKRLRATADCGAGCKNVAGCRASCKTSGDALSATLLDGARTNGQLFLALPANEAERNSTKEHGTLLNIMCGAGPSADDCRGPTAAQAEFRSERGADSRLMGLASIWLGALGMLLVFGLLALRLLVAAVAAMLYLLLAPAIALAPALGEAGRALFRAWTIRLLGACVSKLAYSFLLGVLLTVNRMLVNMTALGWWAQWCLLSAFWWTAFSKRHQAFALLSGRGLEHPAHRSRMVGWRVIETLELARAARRLAGLRLHRGWPPAADVQRRRLRGPAGKPHAQPALGAAPPATADKRPSPQSSRLREDIRAWVRSHEP